MYLLAFLGYKDKHQITTRYIPSTSFSFPPLRTLAKKEMRELMSFETKLSQIMVPPQSRRNFSEIYNKVELGELKTLVRNQEPGTNVLQLICSFPVPDFDFDSYLSPLLPRKLNDSESVVIYALPFYQKLTKLLQETNKR
jgi:hypothetical protein